METTKKKFNLTTKIFIALILGAVLGIILHYFVPASTFRDKILIDGLFYIIGNGFLRLMQMLVVPLVFCSLVCG
ncbi:cation:dicarboxylate symporter family transporter, partial [Terrisporobacter hibernicus]